MYGSYSCVAVTLPTGTVTFVFTDIEGSTGLLQALGRETYGRPAVLPVSFDPWRRTVVGSAGITTAIVGTAFGTGSSVELVLLAMLAATVAAVGIVARSARVPIDSQSHSE